MAFKFRFPIALMSYIDGDDKIALQNAIEKAREWAIPLEGERKKRPTLQDAADYIEEIRAEFARRSLEQEG